MERNQIEVHRDPQGSAYSSTRTFARRTSLSPAAFPDLHVAVDELP